MNATPLRRGALVAGAALVAVSLAACAASPGTAGTGEAGEPQQGGVLDIAFFKDNTDLVSLDPFQVYWIEHRVVIRNVAESLTDQDPETGEIIPWLAESWEVSDDALEYTFHLREDVEFSNGEPFDATAVQTAFDANKAFAEENPAVFGATYLSGYERTEIVDDRTVTIVLDEPNAGFLQATSTTNLAILAPESYERTPEERSAGAIIGTGPFVLAEYEPEVGLRLERREGYGSASAGSENTGDAYLDAVEIAYVAEESVRNGQFVQGEVDVLWPREPFAEVDIDLFEANGATIQSRSLPGPALNLFPNVSEGRILSDPLVREALQKSIDRESYAATIYSADYPVVESIYDTTTPFFASQADGLAHDPEGAADLLDEAGWELGDDGYRHKDGERLTLVRNVAAEDAGLVLVQDQLKQVGIDLEIRVLAAGELTTANAAGDYDLHSSYMTRADPIILQSILDPRFTNGSALSTSTYSPEQLDEVEDLFDAGLRTSDEAELAEAYAGLQELFIEEDIAFPLYERLWQAATGPQVHGFAWTAEGFALLGDIWLSE